jgi:protein-disulfide isomerase
MASGKKSKEARRIAATKPPPVVSKGGVRRRQANPRVLMMVGGAAVLIAVAVVLAVVLTGGKKSSSASFPTVGSLASGLPAAADVESQLKGIPQHGNVLGSPSAPVTMVEYIDLQCPICQQFETQVMPDILTKYVKTGKVKIEARVLRFIGPDSLKARNAMLAAGQQNKAFNVAQLIYYNQGTENTGWVTSDLLGQIASSIPGLRVHAVLDGLNASSVTKQGDAMDKQGSADKVPGTPTIYVGKTGTKGKVVKLTSATDSQALVTALDAALAA